MCVACLVVGDPSVSVYQVAEINIQMQYIQVNIFSEKNIQDKKYVTLNVTVLIL